jgi:uncharacterized integral membrane protein
MFARYALSVVFMIVSLALLAVAITNGNPIQLSLFGSNTTCPEGMLLASGLIVGWLGGVSVSRIFTKKVASQKRKLEWVAQDAKLAAEVRSDREKQLEAKINTLEAALKSALKK